MITIVPLDSSRAQDFLSLFDVASFAHAEHWSGCYCRFYHTDCSMEEWTSRNREQNKEDAFRAISNNEMAGFLAYDGNKCVGWLNSGDVQNYPRIYPYVPEPIRAKKTALSICFVISKDYRNQGIASMLLDYAIGYAKEHGYEQMLALPFEAPITERMYRGLPSMYLKRGYVLIDTAEAIQILLKTL
ncbi:MAG: N-acetyltransferase family protein [Candidatus Izemoplasmatales bacterium]